MSETICVKISVDVAMQLFCEALTLTGTSLFPEVWWFPTHRVRVELKPVGLYKILEGGAVM